MQVCNHPYLLHHTRPEDEEDCEVVGVSTKWQLMDRLVPMMHEAKQRILLLSQSPKSLDLVEVPNQFTLKSFYGISQCYGLSVFFLSPHSQHCQSTLFRSSLCSLMLTGVLDRVTLSRLSCRFVEWRQSPRVCPLLMHDGL